MSFLDTELLSAQLRARAIDVAKREILITQLGDSQQSKDLTLPFNCNGFGRVHHFRRESAGGFPPNPLPIDPAHHALMLPYEDLVRVQVFQNAVCSWRCWYCFVDYNLLSGNLKYASFLTAEQLLDLYQAEDRQFPIIDLSGGQPDLVPEWILWFLDAVRKRGLRGKVYVWSDDNLSNDYLWRYLSSGEITRLTDATLYGRVGCFKGFDETSFSFNTNAQPALFGRQFEIMKKLVVSGLDVYGYVTMTSPNAERLPAKIADFADRLQEQIHPLFPLRVIPLPIKEFTPMKGRTKEQHQLAMSHQHEAVAAWNAELSKRFPQEQLSKRVFEHLVAA
jgi:uncharacterized Fe-S cluster-containing radical SAM superfamily protein